MAVLLCFGLSSPALAVTLNVDGIQITGTKPDEESPPNNSGTIESSSNKKSEDATSITDITLPTSLPVYVDSHGNVTTAQNIQITNTSDVNYVVSAVTLEDNSGWQSENFYNLVPQQSKVNHKIFSLYLNGCTSTGASKIHYANSGFEKMKKHGGKQTLNYSIKIAPQTTAQSSLTIANVVFTIGEYGPVSDTTTNYYNYIYDSVTGGYNIELTDAYKAAINKGQDFNDWKAGTALLNPGCTYNGNPVTSYTNLFSGMTIPTVNLSLWDTSNVKAMNGMFQNCKCLTNLDLEDFDTSKLTDVGNMFNGCTQLKDVNLTAFDTSHITNMCAMFKDCSELTAIDVDGFNVSTVTDMSSMFSGCTKLASFSMNAADYANAVTTGGDTLTAAQGYTGVKFTPTENGLAKWNAGAITTISEMFKNCSSLTYLNLSNFNLNNANTTDAFMGCTSILHGIVKENCGTIANDSSNKPTSFTFREAWDSNPMTATTITDSNLNFDSTTGTIEAGTTTKPTGDLDLPSSVDGVKVINIGSSAFQSCKDITSVKIPSIITSIGSGAFYNCSGLTSITIPSSITSIGEKAFADCSGLTSITIPSNIASVGSYTFYNCSGLTSITIPSNVTSIGDYVFVGCSGLATVKILSTNLTSVGSSAFNSLKAGSTIYVKNSTIKALFTSGNYTAGNTTITVDSNIS